MVNSVLESHQAIFLKCFRLNFYLNKSAQSVVAKWLEFVWSSQVEILNLNFRCESFKHAVVLEDLMGKMRPMKFLQNLSLMTMKVSGEDVSLFLRNCPFLRKLKIVQSFLTSDVHISGETLVLENLYIIGCRFSEYAINISAPNLSIVYVDARPGQLWFKNVPRLIAAFFSIIDPSYTMHHFVSALPYFTSRRQILTLSLASKTDDAEHNEELLRNGFPQLPNLKILTVNHSCLLPVTHVISACPRLEYFIFKCLDKAKDATIDHCTRVKMLEFKGSCVTNIIQSVTYISESGAFQIIKNLTSLMSEENLKQFQAPLSQHVHLQFQVQFQFLNIDNFNVYWS